mmetsp:Transcript_13578/g.42913  ORF Transcript_13578/g.42913 Transcript_13578/m.42913 type:complete len:290 (+) Transcript_13578:68-937(+)
MCRSLDKAGAADVAGEEAPGKAPRTARGLCCPEDEPSGRGRTWSQETSASGSTVAGQSAEDAMSRQTTPMSPRNGEVEPPKYDTCIILDWDDTLLCTSFLNLKNGEIDQNEAHHLHCIESAVVRLLECSRRVGHVFIVTNSVSGWVEYSAAEYLPAVLPLLEDVQIISARDRFEVKFPDDWNRWKTEAFLDVERELDPQVTCNVISLGDSEMEMDAAHVLGGALGSAAGSGTPSVHVKTVKFRERPTPEELHKQLELVLQKFEKIVDAPKGLKICLERKWVGNSGTTSR